MEQNSSTLTPSKRIETGPNLQKILNIKNSFNFLSKIFVMNSLTTQKKSPKNNVYMSKFDRIFAASPMPKAIYKEKKKKKKFKS